MRRGHHSFGIESARNTHTRLIPSLRKQRRRIALDVRNSDAMARENGQRNYHKNTTEVRAKSMKAMTVVTVGQRPRAGILLMLAAVACFTALDGAAKVLVHDYSIVEIAWGRYLFNLLLLSFFIPRLGMGGLVTTAKPVLQIVRGFLLLTSTASLFAALQFLPMADTYAITFISPIIVAALSVPLLKEQIRPSHWVAILCGFLGVIVVIRPGSGAVGSAAIFPLIMALAYATYQIVTRTMSAGESAITTVFYTALVGSASMSCALPVVWRVPTMAAWTLFFWMGLVGLIGQLLLFKAFRLAPASLLSPFAYTQILWACMIGYAVFGDVPDFWTAIGSLIIVASGLFLVCYAAFEKTAFASRPMKMR